jgi:hypothetical protein
MVFVHSRKDTVKTARILVLLAISKSPLVFFVFGFRVAELGLKQYTLCFCRWKLLNGMLSKGISMISQICHSME